MLWNWGPSGIKEFKGGRENWYAAVCTAMDCHAFTLDVAEGIVAQDERSCYNCRYRRWTETSFTCHRPVPAPYRARAGSGE